ncbi:MAG: AsmA family protein [Steroidobacterales bacterium]
MASLNRVPPWVRWIGGSLIILVLLVLCLGLMDWNAARGPLSRMLSHRLERDVTIGGPLRLHLFSSTPSVDVENLTIGNPDWAGGGNMLELPRLHVAVLLSRLFTGRLLLQTLELDNPKVSLLRDDSGRANWDFGNPGEAKPKRQKPTRLPPLLHFALQGGNLNVNDAIRKLTFQGTVGATENRAGNDSAPFRLQGQGTLNKEPFKLIFEGDALLHIKLDHPYHFKTGVDAGPSSAKVSGTIAKPFDFGGVDADLELQGQNLANLYYLTNLALPLTPPYQLAVRLHRDGNHFALNNIVGKIGSSDVQGNGSVDLADKDGRPRLTASIASHSLNLGDLGATLGAGVPQPADQRKPSQTPAPKQEPISPLLLPTFEFQFDRLRSMDAAVDFRADSVQTQKVPFKNVSFKLKLDNGVLNIDPVDFELPAGKLAGQIRLNTGGGAPQATLDIRLSDINLEQFKSAKSSAAPPLAGVMQGRLRLDGHGNSVHAIAADANGTLSAVLPHGEMREAFAELAGIDMVRGLGLLLGKKDQSTAIRCGIIAFELKDGDAQAQRLVFDTTNVLVTGDGHITLNDEMLDLNVTGKPKKFRFDRLRSPINIRGTLRHPSASLSVPAVVKQGAVAAGLAAIGTPIAAALAFIDPGLAKDADCAGLISETDDKVE